MSGLPRPDLDLDGLTAGPDARWGGVRLVPLLRDAPVPGLRLHGYVDGEGRSVTARPHGSRAVTYVPHSYTAPWAGDGGSAYGTQLVPAEPDGDGPRREAVGLRRPGRGRPGRAGFPPLHQAVEGYLCLRFGEPTFTWTAWDRSTVRQGSGPGSAAFVPGGDVGGLAEALRVFEIHRDQCGVAVYVADTLASVHVYPHPEDYRALHHGLLLDLFAETLYTYGLMYPDAPVHYDPIDPDSVHGVNDLRRAVAASRASTSRVHAGLLSGALTGDREFRSVQEWQGFTVRRFFPSFSRQGENHVGEIVTDPAGRTALLQTFRLSPAQVRRGHLLRTLEENEWSVREAATDLHTSEPDLLARLRRAGLGALLAPGLLARHRRARL
ncbi:ARPP-2 domain-containing protein [Nocardiopsis aegyptia]|uniref:ARG and Rhodanese-Phosphatase-superfamily-associated domain-containing protein n=1 Tax=Nocardiopsis aegyptia TaxID=220378 RepID=A0A7Z0EHY7_9ACTN|nr:hypothetical protein [Nocardiopsis aegyptia]NYJ32422.1 hypothetical protein [Nocardiopsis aegyptia]